MKRETISIPDYTRGEEWLNTLTHAAGAGMGVVFLILCLAAARSSADPLADLSAVLYGLSVTAVFFTSALYHGAGASPRKRRLRVADHCMIYFGLAGTATPCALLSVHELSAPRGWAIFLLGWLGLLVGVFCTVFFFNTTKALQMVLYIGVGTVMFLIAAPLFGRMNQTALHTLFLGSFFLLLGAALYGIGRNKRYFHSVFHIAVLVGCAVLFHGIYAYVFHA